MLFKEEINIINNKRVFNSCPIPLIYKSAYCRSLYTEIKHEYSNTTDYLYIDTCSLP